MSTVVLNQNTQGKQLSGVAYSLPKGFVRVVGDLQPGKLAVPAKDGQPEQPAESPYYKVTLSALIEPDPGSQLVLRPDASCWAHDTFGITVTNNLLSSINATNADKVRDVFVSLSGLAGLVFHPSVVTLPGRALAERAPKHFEFDLDPAQYATKKPLGTTGISAKITPEGPAPANPIAPRPSMHETANKNSAEYEGVLYRPSRLFTIEVSDAENSYLQQVLLPDPNVTLSLVPERSLMVTKSASITFDHGMLTAFSFNSPSQVLGWVTLPLDMAKAFISVPTDLIQLKLNFSNTNNALNEALLKNLQDQVLLLQAQYNLRYFAPTNSASNTAR